MSKNESFQLTIDQIFARLIGKIKFRLRLCVFIITVSVRRVSISSITIHFDLVEMVVI